MQQLQDWLSSFPTITLIVGFVLLLLGGDLLVRGAVVIAKRWGISTLFIGLTIVSFGTSAPELFFNVIAAVGGKPDLSFGNVVGSNIANIGLVLGLAALISPLAVHSRIIRKELPWLIVVSFLMVLAAWFVPHVSITPTQIPGFGRIDGVVMLIIFALFCLIWLKSARTDGSDALGKELSESAEQQPRRATWLAWLFFLCGLILLLVGGKAGEIGAVGVAKAWGMSDAFIGLTIVALATSMPEVATSVIAAVRGHTDLAVGNVVGSNLFNILLVMGATATIAPVPVPEPWGHWDLIAMVILTLILFPIALSKQRRITRIEGAVLLLMYGGYMAWSVMRETI